MKATRSRYCWVHMFTTHRPTFTLQLHNFDLFRTCRTALLRGNWQDFNWHDASRRLSAIAELLVFYFKLELHQVWLQSLMSDDFRILRTSCSHVSKKGCVLSRGRPICISCRFVTIFRCHYRAMLCIRGTSHGPVSVCHKSVFYRNGWTNRAGFGMWAFFHPS